MLRVLALTGILSLAAQPADLFDSEIAPVLRQNCLPCHDSKTRTSGFSIESRGLVIGGGARRGAAVKPGDPSASTLIKLLRGEIKPQMPLGKTLPPEVIAKIESWISQLRPEISTNGRRHWAFIKPVDAPPPSVKTSSWARNEIDQFILNKLEVNNLARLVESGVRHVMAIHGVEISKYSWDDHGNIGERMPGHAAEVDKPVGALIRDLKQRGLLDSTLVVWASEMGRTPMINALKQEKPGRDHNQYGLAMWMAGGDVKGGSTAGQTDDFGLAAAEHPIPLRDVHATLLHLMGLDDARLTYLHAGRYRRLTDIGGAVLKPLIA